MSGFPECRNTKSLLVNIGIACPLCSDGQIVVRRSKKGRRFYGCSNYPQCDFVSWDEPVNKKCPDCGQILLLKKSARQGSRYVCYNQKCDFTENAAD